MLKRLTKLANKLDAMGWYDLATELDEICREAAKWVDLRHRIERGQDSLQGDPEDVPRVEKELRPRPGDLGRLYEEGTYEEDRSEPTPEEKLEKEFPGKREDVDLEELSEEDLPVEFKVERDDEKFQMDLEPDQDKLVELMESGSFSPEDDADDKKDDDEKDDKKDKDDEEDDGKDEDDEKDALDGLWS